MLPFGLKCSHRILTFMVKPIVNFLRGRVVSLTSYMDDFPNQASCRCKAIFHIHVIALVFMCCGWSINWVKTILDPSNTPTHLGDHLGHLKENYRLTRSQNHPGGSLSERSHGNERNHPGDSRMFCGYLSQYCSGSMEGSSTLQGSPNSTPSLP